jgi:hypothetical protein
MIFGTQLDATQQANTVPEAAISNYLQSVWATFAKDPENALYHDPFGFPDYGQMSK